MSIGALTRRRKANLKKRSAGQQLLFQRQDGIFDRTAGISVLPDRT